MNRAQHSFASPARPDRFVCLVCGARDVAELIDAVRDYLAAWPAQKVARLQTVDAGWAPFDENQRPAAFYKAADLRELCETVHGQCAEFEASTCS